MQNRIIIVQGKKGSGKTTLCNEMLESEKRYIVVDSLREYTCGTTFESVQEFAGFAKTKMRGKIQSVVRVGTDDDFDKLCRIVKVLGEVKPILYVVEEADIRCSPTYLPASLDQLIRYGRHWGVSLLAISRRPAEITRHLTAQADTIIAFQTFEPRDLEFFRKRCGLDFARDVARLKPHRFIVWGDMPKALDKGQQSY
jgi:DNA helicase HerA-like ATPase